MFPFQFLNYFLKFSISKLPSRSMPFIVLTQCLIVFNVISQPTIQWQKSFGGSGFEELYAVDQTADSGFVMIGVTFSNNGDVSGNHGGVDFWVLKLDEMGSIQWKKAYGGSNNDWPYAIQQTADNGYILTGRSNSNNGDVSGNHGDHDFWVVKLNENGAILWKKTLGGSAADEAYDIIQTTDGGFVLVGGSTSINGDVSGNHGYSDFWIVRLSALGNLEWQKSMGGTNGETAKAVRQTQDGGYILAGETLSNDGDVAGNNGNTDFWVVKISPGGSIEWQKTLGGTGLDAATSICLASNGDYLIAGYTGSNVPGFHGNFDYWITRLNPTGNILWQKAYGGSNQDQAREIQAVNSGGFVIIGDTQSTNGDVTVNDGGKDIWVLKINEQGEILWQKTFGGTMAEGGYAIQTTSDNGYILGGYSWSVNGDVSENHGDSDFWIIKLSPESTSTTSPNTLPLVIYPNPAQNTLNLNMPQGETMLYVSICNISGQEMSRFDLNNTGLSAQELPIDSFEKGIYLLSAIGSSGRIYYGKFVKA